MEAEDDQENNGSCEKGLSSSNFKVKIDLKLKKNKDESCGDEDVRQEKNLLLMKQKKDHICCECGKEFSSGKALGGHMSSAHVQANQRLEESWKKKKYSIKRSRFDDYDDDEEVVQEEEEIGDVVVSCEICHKNFPSKKSLFGHMRCHPDREWRGMKPPSKNISKNKGFRASFHDEDVNEGYEDRFASLRDEEEEEGGNHFNVVELPSLKDWGAKDRRGRSPLKRSVSSTILDDDKELHDAVQQLISLVNGDVNNNNNNNNRSEVMMSSSNSVGSAPKEADFRDLKDKSKKKGAVDDTKEKNREEIKKRKREKELVKLEPGQDLVPSPVLKKSVEVKYKCNECGRMFATHQALGGHRSSHNKFKISIENTIDEIKGNNTQDHGQLGNQQINNYGNNIIINDQYGSNNNVHKCKFCDKIFPTGQALGGHQRSHLTNNQEESSSQNASKVLDFDLNELPHLDDYTLL
ncbi:hypothetical protein R3W88_030418 [Solanum pinnatisectum]|uniref:C2H2-type domain-containing protein n=1 Tax=Solanum pinnatisectum TaxID=50273 RepID=A0AAV9K819_9SOLN|nr:hypothetical protein R3W88_030418 [Solanum pinnatisectum]